MTSSIFYKFKNSRDSERIVFNGTDLSVFGLIKDIIGASGLGDGIDFREEQRGRIRDGALRTNNLSTHHIHIVR